MMRKSDRDERGRGERRPRRDDGDDVEGIDVVAVEE
jgi:hypothetical protein